ncbi:hypothetical protein CCACVL1_10284 [Corchorus capsularis]|uniref:Uncharacterized protein n=1 Tax=Corchorus capsularis TaxID=210143 RepID=A0A1R3IRU5_COCAP|nr:hypothetical protein CCACVL1_10284 [Corchorus capsularis]
MIHGQKNFLPLHPLTMGFGLLFRLDESSLGSHLNERRVWGEEVGSNDVEESGSPMDNCESKSEEGGETIDVAELAVVDKNGVNDVGNVNVSVIVDSGIAYVSPY